MPKVTKFGSNRLVKIDLSEYWIDWEKRDDVSRPQTAVKDFLYPYWKRHAVTWETRIPGSLIRVDIMDWTSYVAIEVSPSKSHSFNKFFHKTPLGFGAAMKRELGKGEWLKKNGFTLVEIFDEDIPVLSPQWFKDTYDIDL